MRWRGPVSEQLVHALPCLKTSSPLWLQQFGKAWKLLERDADRMIVAEQEFLARVRSPANFGDPGRENACQTPRAQPAGARGTPRARAHAPPDRREQLGLPLCIGR